MQVGLAQPGEQFDNVVYVQAVPVNVSEPVHPTYSKTSLPKALPSSKKEVKLTAEEQVLLPKLGITKLGTSTLANGYDVDHYVLKNGHQVLIEKRKDNLVSLRTYAMVGSSNEDAVYKSTLYQNKGFKSGIAHLDEHCHFLSTKNYPEKNEWVERIEAYGVSLNASTSDEEVQHELHFNREDLPSMLQLHAEQVLHPHYDDTFIEQEKKNVLNEASERLESSTLRLMDKGFELMFDRPISYQTLGNREDVQATTAKDLQKFFDTYYTPTNMLTVLSGNITPTDVLPLMNKEFGHQPAKPAPLNNVGLKWAMKPDEIREQTYTDPKLSGLSMVMLGFEGPKRANRKERAVQEILETYLTGGDLSPLNRHLVDEKHLAMDVSMMTSPQKKSGISMFMMHSFEGHESQAANALMDELELLSTEPIDAKKLKEAKQTLIHNHKMALRYSEHSSEVLGSEGLTGTLDYVSDYGKYVNAVTQQDIKDYANKYMDGSSYALVYALPGNDFQESDKTSSKSGVLPSFVPHVGMPTGELPPTENNDDVKTLPLPHSPEKGPISPIAKIRDDTPASLQRTHA